MATFARSSTEQCGLGRKTACILVLSAFVLTACAENPDGSTANIFSDVSTLVSGNQSSEQKELSRVQRQYASARVTGAAGGALLAGFGTALAGGNTEQIAAAAVVGGTAGYLGASALTQQNANFRLSRDTLQKDIEAARTENQRMTRSVAAANDVVKYQREEITRLNSGYRQGSVSLSEYQAKYATMEKDLATMRSLEDTSTARLNSLNQSISAYQRAGIGTSQLSAERNKQRTRVNQLRQAEAAMVRNLSNVPAGVS